MRRKDKRNVEGGKKKIIQGLIERMWGEKKSAI